MYFFTHAINFSLSVGKGIRQVSHYRYYELKKLKQFKKTFISRYNLIFPCVRPHCYLIEIRETIL
jgi:hypothetical protein